MGQSTQSHVRWLALPRCGIGYLQVGGELFQVREIEVAHPDGSGCRVWQLETSAIVIEPSPEGGVRCSACGEGRCPHCEALLAGLELIERRRLAEAVRVTIL